MFYSPCLLWRLLYDKSGIRLKDIMSFANDKSNVQPAARRANINGLAMHLSSVFNHRFRFGTVHPYHHKMLKFLNLRFYVSLSDFFVPWNKAVVPDKRTHTGKIEPQLFRKYDENVEILKSSFLRSLSDFFVPWNKAVVPDKRTHTDVLAKSISRNEFTRILWLWNIMGSHNWRRLELRIPSITCVMRETLSIILAIKCCIASNERWTESPNFPVVTYCDLKIRILGNVQRHTVQCVLVINIFTEKIFLLLWLWYTLLAIISLGSITSWIYTLLSFDQRRKFIARRLELADVDFKQRNFKVELDEFVRDFIKTDGVFVLRMITIHSGVLICTEVVDTMWDQFLAEQGSTFKNTFAANKGDYKEERSISVGAHSLDRTLGRKTSVLVPLMSREDLTHLPDNLFRSSSEM
ncbi:Innexin [Dictyocaulus viviparus]|uniref:Innexin n=1 Tax=Dictyocaulus viviparus TaxID=29172 RepID=A0A0D8Y6R2_DICVI|nr:Innexin [Dictyocaulus viviparus]